MSEAVVAHGRVGITPCTAVEHTEDAEAFSLFCQRGGVGLLGLLRRLDRGGVRRAEVDHGDVGGALRRREIRWPRRSGHRACAAEREESNQREAEVGGELHDRATVPGVPSGVKAARPALGGFRG